MIRNSYSFFVGICNTYISIFKVSFNFMRNRKKEERKGWQYN